MQLDVVKNYTTYAIYYRLVKAIEDDPDLPKKKAARALAKFMSLHPHNIEQKTEVMVEHFRQKVLLSRFSDGLHRGTLETAHRRDEFVAALVDEIWFAHINPGGWTEKIVERVKMWRIPFQGPTEAEKVI